MFRVSSVDTFMFDIYLVATDMSQTGDISKTSWITSPFIQHWVNKHPAAQYKGCEWTGDPHQLCGPALDRELPIRHFTMLDYHYYNNLECHNMVYVIQ